MEYIRIATFIWFFLLQLHSWEVAGQCRHLRLQFAVELRLREKSAGTGCTQDLIDAPHFLILALELLDALHLGRGRTRTRSGIDLHTLDPLQQRLRHTADLRGDRLHRRPQRRVLTTVLLLLAALRAHGPQVKTCLTCSWLHSLKRWSLLETRGGSRLVAAGDCFHQGVGVICQDNPRLSLHQPHAID
jgi:hypothetical protein